MTSLGSAAGDLGEIHVPAPPQAPSPADFPTVAPIEPPRLPEGSRARLVALIGLLVGLVAGARFAVPALELAPALFVGVGAAGWWIDRRTAYLVAACSTLAWTVAAVGGDASGLPIGSGLLLGAALGVIGALVGTARERELALRTSDRQREQARAILAAQLRESVVSIDVAVPLIADPLTLDRAQGAAYDQVRRHARGLARLANDLLTLDQVDMKKMALTLVPVDLASFVLEIVDQRLPSDRATIVAPATPVPVLADPERLRQLIDHLLQNALKFSPPSAGIMVSVAVSGDEARVAVRDHGVGLSTDDLGVLFTRYGRIRDTRTANVPGMGLGLYLAKLIAEAHGGDLTASSPGRGLGATFTLVLPLAGRARRQASRALPASSFWD